jgi:hypothetical protein
MDQNKIWHDPHHLGVPSGASKTISEPIVHSALIVDLSYIKISSISKQTEMSFHLILVIKCVQTDFWAYGTFGANQAPILLGH